MAGVDRDADRGADAQFRTAYRERCGDLRDEVGGDPLGPFGALDVAQHDNEFVATEPGHRISFPNRAPEALRDLLKQFVPGIMAVGVVDVLETIQVQKQQGEAFPVFPGTFQCLLDQVVETDAVRQLRERILQRLAANPFLRELAFRDVAVDGDEAAAGNRGSSPSLIVSGSPSPYSPRARLKSIRSSKRTTGLSRSEPGKSSRLRKSGLCVTRRSWLSKSEMPAGKLSINVFST